MKNVLFVAFTSVLFTSCTKDRTSIEPSTTCLDSVSFKQQILPFILQKCSKCHAPAAGSVPVLSTYQEISKNADAIFASLKGSPVLMPMGKELLPDSLIQQFDCWIKQGKLEN